MSSRAQRVIDWCRTLATLSEEPGCTTRTFLSPPMHEVHARLGEWMRSFGMQVSVDAVGNLRGVLTGDAPRFILASHLDTVPDAGAFDGILGVVLGIALCETLSLRVPHPTIEVIGFSEEEGVRYGLPFIGSKALVGTLDRATIRLIEPELHAFGLDAALIPQARFAPETAAYLEVHIEQGPVLDRLGLPLAVVDSIAGQTRAEVVFEGEANHAGTTPMAYRRDALTAAARFILHVEEVAAAREGLVATVGRVDVTPNAGNVIPGRVSVSVDVRHRCDEVRCAAIRQLKAAAPNWTAHLDQAAAPLDEDLRRRLAKAMEAAGYPVHHMTSGAGHDAMIIAPHIPSAMLFVRSPGGVSHSPKEAVLVDDVEAALAVAQSFVGGKCGTDVAQALMPAAPRLVSARPGGEEPR